MSDYFALFDLPQMVELDLPQLNTRYFALQRQYHPDRYAGKGAEERQVALSMAMSLNEAYNTLKSPLKRAEYLLSLQGVKVNTETGAIKPSSVLLMEVMEMREKLAEATDSHSIQAVEEQAVESKEQAFEQFAAYYGEGQWQQAAQEVIRLKYAEKLLEEIKLKMRLNHAST